MIKEKKKKIEIILWILVFISLGISIYKIYLYGNYVDYISKYTKEANSYYALKEVKKEGDYYLNYNYDGENIKFKVKEYYLLPLYRRIILEGEGTYSNGKEEKEIYGISFYFFSKDLDVEKYIDDKKELEKLKDSKLVYKFNEKELNEFFKKIEKESSVDKWIKKLLHL